MTLIRKLADGGSGIILVTHKIREALDHCDRITVMRAGRKVHEVLPQNVDALALTKLIVGENIITKDSLLGNILLMTVFFLFTFSQLVTRKIMLTKISRLSMVLIYSNSLLYK